MIEYLTIEQVIELHDEMLKRYGGLPGIRDKNLLCSAMDILKIHNSIFLDPKHCKTPESLSCWIFL